MKKLIIFLSLSFFVVSVYAQQPAVKFYLEDGTAKEYNISDIDSFAVSRDNLYVMHIYYQDTKIAYYPNEIIQSFKFDEVSQQGSYLSINIFGYAKHYFLFDIDSIIFKIDKWQPLTIGTQVWMLKNLDVDHYRNGDTIPEVRDSSKWTDLSTGAWCYYLNNSAYDSTFGKLYNWHAVNDTRNLAPTGWHVPSDAEWTILTTYLGGDFVAGGKLKEVGTKHWSEPNEGATNESGFSAIPGGMRNVYYGSFYQFGVYGLWWSSTESIATKAWNRQLYSHDDNIWRDYELKESGFSVRCIKD